MYVPQVHVPPWRINLGAAQPRIPLLEKWFTLVLSFVNFILTRSSGLGELRDRSFTVATEGRKDLGDSPLRAVARSLNSILCP